MPAPINNTGAVRAWLRTCPAVVRTNIFGADYLPDDATGYTLDSVPSTLRYRENILGEMTLQPTQEQMFVFASRAPYGSEFQQNLENLGFFQAVFNWIIEQNSARNFPTWDGGEITAIVPTISAYPIAMQSATARYQLQIRVTYRVTEE